jgi:hypothetical protein
MIVLVLSIVGWRKAEILHMNMEIVFVHADSPLPLHVLCNLYRTKRIANEVSVKLIYNRKSLLTYFWRDKVFLQYDREDNEINHSYNYPKDFRFNFWFNSVGRFGLISKYQKLNNVPILHIESDVIISSDFPITKIAAIKEPYAFSIVSNKRAIASLLFLKDTRASLELWDFAKRAISENSSISDMEILFDLWFSNKKSVSLLPTAPSQLAQFQIGNLDSKGPYSGFFDGNDFGIFLVGTNPWNRRGISKLHTFVEGSLLNFHQSDLRYDKTRKFLMLRDNTNNLLPLFSLHVTNKNPVFFSSHVSSLALRLWTSNFQQWDKTFHPIVFCFMALRALKRRFLRF